ncbi:MAG: flagellar hook-length control protein FliK [Rhodocyclaceae bacterium]|nr:flagellar hook-length control protein FliK [Rhodocyclaceae bacterium]
MALIPPDAGLRMRMQTETNLLQPVRPPHELPSRFPELRPGQSFTAQIQEALPGNTYRALVAGQQLTLQLAAGAKSGDLLELVVVDRSGKVIIAKQADGGTAADGKAAPYPFARFSSAARLIGQLLPADGESAPPAQLNRGQPLFAQPPASGAQLAPTLARAVSQSGLFYEAHQAQWVSGKLPLAQLLQEPQGQRSAPSAFQYAATERAVTTSSILQALQVGGEKVGAGGTAPTGTTALPATAQAGTSQAAAQQAAQTAAQSATFARQVPEELRPLVQQQLEAVATQRIMWQGEVWPKQVMDWEIEWDGERAAGGDDEEKSNWRTALSLNTPRLGQMDATLQLTPSGVRVSIATPHGASAADLRAGAAKLAEALAAAGVPLVDFRVQVSGSDERG